MPSPPSPQLPINRQSAFRFILLPGLTILLLLLIVGATGLGYIKIGPTDIIKVLLLQVGGAMPADLTPSFPFVVMEVRLPRILCAALVGGSLAVAGCVFQSLLHNPLADPYTLGISSGAAFGASLAILLLMFGLTLPGSLIIPLFAFIGAVSTLYVVFSLSAPSARLSSNS
ncbi:MAG: iron chelate uptake ABC transporter family permease subunit, partial [Desulfofustis sp.]|nr:iron chelate uptake ABC transporter family permease subunit [Desulfofustis sp.]